MRISQLFTKTTKKAPKDEDATNAKLLIRAGYIDKTMAGVYSFLPLGLRVLKKIKKIIGQEMNGIGGQELLMTSLQDPQVWKKSGRWSDLEIDVWFKTTLANKNEIGLANTHEEPLTRLMTQHISSYRDLPKYVYQFQTKFRNELRAKGGLIRTREFIMKDLYSFSRDEKEHQRFYDVAKLAYTRIFNRTGIGDQTYVTFASGGSFSKYSHEFQTISEAGEDTIYLDKRTKLAVNKEVYKDEVLKELGIKKSDLQEEKAIEVGNIFTLGTRFSLPLGLNYKDEKGNQQPVFVGSYGIGLGRLMGAIVELNNDEKGIIWPEEVAPFRYYLIGLGEGDKKIKKSVDKIYSSLQTEGSEVLLDDREVSAGQKFNDCDLLGIPKRLVVSSKTLEKDSVEIRERKSGEVRLVKLSKLGEELKK